VEFAAEELPAVVTSACAQANSWMAARYDMENRRR